MGFGADAGRLQSDTICRRPHVEILVFHLGRVGHGASSGTEDPGTKCSVHLLACSTIRIRLLTCVFGRRCRRRCRRRMPR